MPKKVFFHSQPSFLQRGMLAAMVAGFLGVPVINAAIDEKAPTSFPPEVVADWKAQGGDAATIKASLPAEYQAKCDGTLESACHWRRVYRFKQFPFLKTIMFTKHHNIGNIAIGFWVNCGPSDVTDTDFKAAGAVCKLTFDNYYSQFKEILPKTDACPRDLCVSLDGKKVCFAMSGNGKGTGYRLFEMKIDDPASIKQLTQNPAGLTVADNEPCYLPNGDIAFVSTRCFGVIDCGWQPTSNMFLMDSTGKYIRRVGYDQVHTFYPVLRPDGSVMYTRWEYNDRDIANIAGVFYMYPDGCHQTELFGNQTTWPMCMVQARPVPGSPTKFFGIASAHHGDYSGEVFIADVLKNSNGPEIFKMISPPRETKTRDNNDNFAFGGVYRNSEYPYPLNDQWYLVSYHDESKFNTMSYMHNTGKFRIYLKNVDGKSQELLAWADQSLHGAVVVAPWKEIWGEEPVKIAEMANFNDTLATVTMSNVYWGPGMKGIEKSTGVAKKLRVIALRYRVSGACDNGWAGQLSGSKPSDVIFAAPTICPIANYGGSWDVKEVLGEAKIYEDGSASFKVPPRTPLFFQVLDSNGCSIAGMRSWATLMPHETFSCYGCHEGKSESPPTVSNPLAGKAQMLEKPLGIEDKGFDFPKMVQPILDNNCLSCHKSGHASGFDFTGDLVSNSAAKKSFAKSYNSLTAGISSKRSNKAISIATIFSQAPQMAPKSYGSAVSGMMKAINGGVAAMKDVKISDKDKRILACWIDCEVPHAGSYDSYMSSGDASKYKQLEQTAKKWYDIELQNVKDFAAFQAKKTAIGHGNASAAAFVVKQLGIRYLPTQHAVVVNKSSQGTFKMLDLRGKIISRMDLTNHVAGAATIALPATLAKGLYVARFEGADGIQQTKISIAR